jgi:hypothetical protein
MYLFDYQTETNTFRSRYACFGLWMIDLRAVYPPLSSLLSSNPDLPSLGPLMSYPSLTELTRNPRQSRAAIEKNWMIFFPNAHESYIHYDISPVRTFAKLLGNGLTSTNLTDPLELSCLPLDTNGGTWHQATNSLRVILCRRSACAPTADNTVFIAIIHKKFHNGFNLPMRYERYVAVWSTAPPFALLATSQHPLVFQNETLSGWSAAENWDNIPNPTGDSGSMWEYFTYTVSIAYAWGRDKDQPGSLDIGYLDDEIILGLGLDDGGQGYVITTGQELLQCMRACPGSSANV